MGTLFKGLNISYQTRKKNPTYTKILKIQRKPQTKKPRENKLKPREKQTKYKKKKGKPQKKLELKR